MHKSYFGLKEVLVFSAAVAVWVGCQPAAVEETTEEPAPTVAEETEPATPPHWGYGEEAGPAVWGQLSADYAACAEGQNQSPIDLAAATPGEVEEVRAQFPKADLRIVNQGDVLEALDNGHTIQVNYDGGETLTVGDESYRLLQYHFHSPSEHTVGGEHFPMEMHLVHQSSSGGLAVIGVFIEEGEHNHTVDPIWKNLPDEKGEEVELEGVQVDIDEILPISPTTYRYFGSLTTPPCSEGVHWLVMTEPIALSSSQIDDFREVFFGNNRPTQPLNDREVITDRVTGV